MIDPVVDRLIRRFFYTYHKDNKTISHPNIRKIEDTKKIKEGYIIGIKTEAYVLKIFTKTKIEHGPSLTKIIEAEQHHIPLSNQSDTQLALQPYPLKSLTGYVISKKDIKMGVYTLTDHLARDPKTNKDDRFGMINILY